MDGRLRVLLVEPESVPGGMWHYATALYRALAGAGLDVTLATMFPYEPLKGEEDLQVRSIGTHPSYPFPPLLSPRRIIRHLDKVRRLRRLVGQLRPDIIHVLNPLGRLDFLYFRWLKALGPRVVYTAHDARPLTGDPSWHGLARYRQADAILVHSASGVRELSEDGIDASKITQIPLGNFLHVGQGGEMPAEAARRSLGLPDDARAILFFGTVAPYKGLDLLVEAFGHMAPHSPRTYLVIAGEPLEDVAPYRNRIEGLGLARRVLLDLRYIPFEEFPKYFSAAEVVVFPYRRISQSAVLQLAYAFGRPVVVTNVGGLGEAVSEDRTGIIAETADAGGLASAIEHLLCDPQAAVDMGKRARALAETKYSWQTIARTISEVYRSVLPAVSHHPGHLREPT